MPTPNDTPQKRCTQCDKVFPATPDYFYRQAGGKHGVGSWCKACYKPYSAAYYAKHRDTLKGKRSGKRERLANYAKWYYARNKRLISERTKRKRLAAVLKGENR